MDSDDYFPCFLLQIMFQEFFFSILLVFVILLVILFFTGLFSVGQWVLSSLTTEDISEINNEEGVNDRFVKRLIKKPAQIRITISIVQIICFVALMLLTVYGLFYLFGQAFNVPSNYLLLAIGSIVVLFVCTILIPAYIVRNRVVAVARFIAPYIMVADWLLRPLTGMSVLLSVSGKKRFSGDIEYGSKESIDEKDLLQDIILFYNKTTEEIMIPRMDMKAVEVNSSYKDVLDIVMKTGFSRIPVYEETEDDIKGILYVKDLLQSIQKPESFKWQSFIRAAYFIPETKKIDSLLEEFRSNKIHIAIVVDEFGCTSGLVTMEDVIEEIVGEISDEHDIDKRHFLVLPDGDYIFEGKIQLIDFFRETDIPSSAFGKLTEEVDTLAGLLLKIKGTLPHRRDIIDYNGYRFQVLEADQRRVLKIKFSKPALKSSYI